MTKKLPKLKTLKNKLDKTFNLYIRLRDKKCILSKKKDHLQCSHYYDYLQNPYLRWDERNAHAMTNKIHYKHHHGKAPDYAHFMYEKYGMEFMHQLYLDSKKPFITETVKEAQLEIDRLQIEYNKIKSENNKIALADAKNKLLDITRKFYIEKIEYFQNRIVKLSKVKKYVKA